MRLLLIAEESEHTSFLESALKEEAVQIGRESAKGLSGSEDCSRLFKKLKKGGKSDALLLCLEQREERMELLSVLRRECELPVVVVGSCFGNTYYEELRCLEQGADDYFSPSMPVPVMIARMQRLIQLYRSRTEAVRYWSGLEELAGTQDYLWRGESLGLTRTEYQVLSLLLHSREEIVTREKLLTRIWQKEGEQESWVLTAMIQKLRKKLLHTNLCIVSCYGKGYRIEQE